MEKYRLIFHSFIMVKSTAAQPAAAMLVPRTTMRARSPTQRQSIGGEALVTLCTGGELGTHKLQREASLSGAPEPLVYSLTWRPALHLP